MDPLAGSSWSDPATVSGFARSAPNHTLLRYASGRRADSRVLDIGCGAGRNAVPLARMGLRVLGTDLSWPMLSAAAARAGGERVHWALAPMQALPVRDRSIDLIVAHGVWNLASSGPEFLLAVAEASRIAAPAASLFVFTFSRRTLPQSATAVAGETFVYTQFSGRPQVFLSEGQLIGALSDAGFEPDPDLPLRELNRPGPGHVRMGGAPVIFEGGFRRA